MSLLDGLLLDPHRDPREIWIARRADGQKGSGTIADPYDGSKTLGPPMTASLTLKWNEFVVNLGLVAANLPGFNMATTKLRFEGVTGPAKDWFNTQEFRILEVSRFQTHFGQPSALSYVLEPDVAPEDPPDPPVAPPNVQFSWNNLGFLIKAKYTYTDSQGALQTVKVDATIVWPVAKVAFPTAHGLVNFDAVELSGLGGNNSHFNGTYVVEGRTDNSVRIRLSDRFLEDPGSDIAPLSCVVKKFTYRFDEIMRAAPEYALIHLGPGTFETRGHAPTYVSNQNDFRETFVGFVVQFGQRLCGSGIGASVVQLALPMDELNTTLAIGASIGADFAEVADVTVDCNAPGHPLPYRIFPAPVTCGAVNLNGSFIALRRVRAINFCTQARAECFVLGLVGSTNPGYLPTGTFNVVEDCILEQPGENNTHETTLVSSVGDGYGRGRSPVVRRNYVHCSYSNGYASRPIAVASLQRDATDTTLATLTTTEPHAHVTGKALVVQGAKVGGAESAIYNGVFAIEQIVSDTVLRYRLYSDPGTGAVDVSAAVIGVAVPAELVAIQGITYVGNDALVTTKRPHNRAPNSTVLIGGVWEEVIVAGKVVLVTTPFNDAFRVASVVSSTQFKIVRPAGAPSETSLRFFGFSAHARIGVDFHGPAALGGTGCVTERNALYDCYNAFYSDTGATRDAVVRDNYYSDVLVAMIFNYPGPSVSDAFSGASLKRDVQNHRIAIFETSSAHLLSPGLIVTVDGALVNEKEINPYNGNHRVIAVSADAFYYEMKEIPVPDQDADEPTGDNQILFAIPWQNPRHSFERNNYDLYAYDAKWPIQSVGLGTIGYRPFPPFTVPASAPFVFPGFIIRENFLRLRDGAVGQTAANNGDAWACRLDNFENTLIEENVVELPFPFPIHYLNSQGVHAFNNRTSAGALEPLFEDIGDPSGFRRNSGLDDTVEDGLMLSLL